MSLNPFEREFKKRSEGKDINGFSWVIENEIGGMKLPCSVNDIVPLVEKYNLGLVLSLTEHSLGFAIPIDSVHNLHLPVTGKQRSQYVSNPFHRFWCANP